MPAQTTSTAAKTITVGTQRLRVLVDSPEAGTPLLLINGIGASGDLFEPFRTLLADRTTIAFDAPGVGGSPATLFPYSMRRLAGLVAALLDEIGHAKVDVLGYSWGGLLAQELARRHPDRIRKLILAATASGWTSLPGNPKAVGTLLTPLRYYSAANLRRVAPVLYGDGIASDPVLLERQIELRLAHPPSARGYTNQLLALTGWTSLPWLHRINHETLVLAGDSDQMVPLPNAKLLARAIPYATLHVVQGGGHLFLITRAQAMAELVTSFLNR